jgi:hypothetical protein
LCEEEGRPYVQAQNEYVVDSILTGKERRITVCSNHSDQLDSGKLPYKVARKRKWSNWATPL